MAASMGGGLDVTAIVNAVMVKESLSLKTMQNKVTDNGLQKNGYDQIKTLLQTLNTNVDNLTAALSSGFIATPSNDTLLSASITNSKTAYTGTHNLVVTTLAKAEVWGSATPTSSRTSALGYSGDLTMTIGSNNFTINVAAGDTLDNIRDKINNASSNIGVTSSILASTDGLGHDQYTLVLSSNNTGVANKVTVSGTAAASVNLTNELTAATDASFTFDSQTVVRASNTISDVMDGVTFTLLGTGSSTLAISMDQDSQNTNIKTALHSVVDAYNGALAYLDQVTAERVMTDATVSNIKDQIRNKFCNFGTGGAGITSLFDLGVTFAPSVTYTTDKGLPYVSTGRLMVKDTDLTTALNTNRDAIKQFFTTTSTGFIASVDKTLSQITGYQGSIDISEGTINDQISFLNKKIATEQDRLDNVKLALTLKYSNLNALIDKFNRISTFLDQELAGIKGSSSQGS